MFNLGEDTDLCCCCCAREGRTELLGTLCGWDRAPCPSTAQQGSLLPPLLSCPQAPCSSPTPGKSVLCNKVKGASICVHLPSIFFQCLQLNSLTNPIPLVFPPPVKYSPTCHCTCVHRDGAQKPSQRSLPGLLLNDKEGNCTRSRCQKSHLASFCLFSPV